METKRRNETTMDKSIKAPTGIAHFFAAFRYSMSGLRYAVRETAIRQELALGIVLLAFVALAHVSTVFKLILVLLWFFVLVTELLNTAVEAVVDLASPSYHELAKKAKDIGSAAVFCALVLLFTVWSVIVLSMFK